MKTKKIRYPVVASVVFLLLVVTRCEKQMEKEVNPQTNKSDRNARFDPLPAIPLRTPLDPSLWGLSSLYLRLQPTPSPADQAFRTDYEEARYFAQYCARFGITLTSDEIALFTIFPKLREEMKDFVARYGGLSESTANNVMATVTGSGFNGAERDILGIAANFSMLPDPFSRYISTRIMYCIYANNARLAQNKTEEMYGNEGATCPRCKGNAFKHALFRCLDARYFGSNMADLLGDAHESETLQNSDAQIVRDSNMDVHNNDKGLLAFNNYSIRMDNIVKWQIDTWVNHVQTYMHNGYFYYLGGDGITQIPSNQ